jgi:maltose/maltodextrin transport system permease protein
LFPLLAVVSISLRPGNFATGSLIPTEISLEHWKLALGFAHTQADGVVVQPPFPVLLWLWNSIKIATISSLLIVGVSTTAAYGFARLKFRFKSTILNSMLLLQMFPVAVALVAIYAIFEAIGGVIPWLGIETHGGLIVAYIGGVAMHIWTIKGYFETIPTEIEECAKVDGATSWQAFYKVLLPMAVPILMVVFVLAFIGTIIEYPIASVLAARRAQPDAGRGLQVLPVRAALLVGRLCRGGGALGPAHYAGVSCSATLDRVGADLGRREGLAHRTLLAWQHEQLGCAGRLCVSI